MIGLGYVGGYNLFQDEGRFILRSHLHEIILSGEDAEKLANAIKRERALLARRAARVSHEGVKAAQHCATHGAGCFSTEATCSTAPKKHSKKKARR